MDVSAWVEGHRLLQRAGFWVRGNDSVPRELYDSGHLLHDLQLNAWVLAFRRAAGDGFLSWEGVTQIEPPAEAGGQQGVQHLGDYWSAEWLRDRRARRPR